MAMDAAAVESVPMIEFCPNLELPQWDFCLTIIGDDSFFINPDSPAAVCFYPGNN
jgi:hypothetical protein